MASEEQYLSAMFEQAESDPDSVDWEDVADTIAVLFETGYAHEEEWADAQYVDQCQGERLEWTQ